MSCDCLTAAVAFVTDWMNRSNVAIKDQFKGQVFVPAVAAIILCPLIWNLLARLEYRTHIITAMACGSKYVGCYILGTYIATTSFIRDLIFDAAVATYPTIAVPTPVVWLGYAMIVCGMVLVVSSYWRLGFTGTFLGDYFGILMAARVVGFPFNVTDHPMYHGASLAFLGRAIVAGSPLGVVLSMVVFAVYRVAAEFEGDFTTRIYADAAAARHGKKKH